MPCGLYVHRCSTIQGIFVHPDFIAATMDDSGMVSLGAAAMADAGQLTTKASGLAVSYSMAAGVCHVD